MKKLLIVLLIGFCLTKANAQQSNEREQRANQIATKEINSQKVTTAAERERIKRDAQIESMGKDKPNREPQGKADKEKKDKIDRPDKIDKSDRCNERPDKVDKQDRTRDRPDHDHGKN